MQEQLPHIIQSRPFHLAALSPLMALLLYLIRSPSACPRLSGVADSPAASPRLSGVADSPAASPRLAVVADSPAASPRLILCAAESPLLPQIWCWVAA